MNDRVNEEEVGAAMVTPNARLAALLSASRSGDLAAARDFVQALHPVLFRFFRARTGSAGTAEDRVQECWIRIHQARSSYRTGEPVLPCVFAIAPHPAIDPYPKEARHPGGGSPIEDSPGPFIDPRSGWMNRLAAGPVLSHLIAPPEGQREVFVMMKVRRMSLAELARAAGSNSRAVKQKLYRACEPLGKTFAGGSAAGARGGRE